MAAARRALVAGVCLAAGGLVWLTRDGARRAPERPAPERPEAALAERTPPPQQPTQRSAALARIEELRALSETYRGTTFVTAIRSAGFVCYELVGVYGGLNDSAAWTVNCADMLAYTVRVDANGDLAVEPTAQYLDGLAPGAPRNGRPAEPTLPLPR